MAAWGGLLLSWDGVYWDDWSYVDSTTERIMGIYEQGGMPWFGYLVNALVQLGPIAYHLISFISFLVVGLAVFGIMQRVHGLTPNERLFVAAVVLVLPLTAARHALSVQHYALSYALFFSAWYLLVRWDPPSRLIVIVSAALFTMSFITQSLLSFYLLPVVHLWHRSIRAGWYEPPGVPLSILAPVRAHQPGSSPRPRCSNRMGTMRATTRSASRRSSGPPSSSA